MSVTFARADLAASGASNGQVNAAGTTQTSGPTLRAGHTVLNSTAGQTAATLPSGGGGMVMVTVTGGTAATIFPPSGGKINNGAADASSSVASGASVAFVPLGNGRDYARIG